MRPLFLLAAALPLVAQTDARSVTPFLTPLATPDLVASEIRHYLIGKAPAPPSKLEPGLRQRFLEQIVFQGWPKEWIDAPLEAEDLGLIPSADPGYRMRRLRLEIVPGFFTTAILYEPAQRTGKLPAVLNVNGHVGAPGKSVEYKQKRCVELARMGALALNLEWLGFGELTHPENTHWNAARLDLAGANGLGLFYLAMRKGLDYLHQHPNTDPARLAVTGLSGGGWQTIVLSALDPRVTLAAPVAGFSAIAARIERTADTGDYEQNATDMLTVADYPHLVALRSPRPTLLIYNAEDDCCFRAPLVKPDIYDRIRPLFESAGVPANLAWHENLDPSDHNYQLDNRLAFYRFIARHFNLKAPAAEAPAELLSYEQTVVGLPPGNLTIAALASRLAARKSAAADLKTTLRYSPDSLARAWPARNSKSKGLETIAWRLDFSNGLAASAVWLRAIASAPNARATIILNDKGKAAAATAVSDRVNRGENVFAVDLFLHGDSAPEKPGPAHYVQMFNALGDRPLGLQAAQLAAIVAWVRESTGASEIRIETAGPRTHLAAVAAASLHPGLFSEKVIRDGLPSLRALLQLPYDYLAQPELYVFGLLAAAPNLQ
ncbi:MAG: acetylxylan esterase [Acidobacteria bacterium]|nr:acetylxylan esterase [Acidobacteriota bacterium]